jgi:hypothetical protein
LQIENYITQNSSNGIASSTTKLKLDDDWIWEIANSIRWLSQTFREKFKIERFLFGEIYANYFMSGGEFILSLMEELGYDKDENNLLANSNPNNNSSHNNDENLNTSNRSESALNKSSPSSRVFLKQQFSPQSSNNQVNNNARKENVYYSMGSCLNESQEDTNQSLSSQGALRINNLFEEPTTSGVGDLASSKVNLTSTQITNVTFNLNKGDLNESDENSQSSLNITKSCDLLDSFKKKKT